MKSLLKITIAFFSLAFSTSCGNSEGNIKKMGELRDSIFAAYPSVAAVTINVENDNELLIAIGSENLYLADDLQRQNVANEMGAMANRIFGKNNKLEHGKIVVTKNETNHEAQPSDGLTSQMDFTSIKKAQ